MPPLPSLLLALLPLAAPADLRVGMAQRDITPAMGAEIPGMLERVVGTGVADPLYVVAAVFDSGKDVVALVGIDALCITEPTVTAARNEIERRTRIRGDHVLIGASHTHTGGPIRPALDDSVDRPYLDRVHRAIVEAVEEAYRSREPARVALLSATAPGIAFNRRFLMRDGREITHPGKPGTPHHADIVRPAGPVDDAVGVLAVMTPAGTLRGAIVNFACHATTRGGTEFSADYIGVLRRQLSAKHSSSFRTLFLLGACGDVTQIDNLSPEVQTGNDYSERFGGKLADAVELALKGLSNSEERADRSSRVGLDPPAERLEPKVGQDPPYGGPPTVAAVQRKIAIPIRPDPDVDRERPPFGLGSGAHAFFERERALVAKERASQPNVTCEVQAIRINELAIVTCGGELFAQDGLRIKACSPFPDHTWVSTLTNQWLGYVPPASAFVTGGYEPRTRRGSKLSIDASQRLIETALEALHELPQRGME